MTELKTLKDIVEGKRIEQHLKNSFDVELNEGQLRAEAVKDIKDLDNDGGLARFCQCNPFQSIRDYIKWKNNLTESDIQSVTSLDKSQEEEDLA